MKLKTCATCTHWQASDRGTAYLAPCPLAQRRTQFDEVCAAHCSLPITAGEWYVCAEADIQRTLKRMDELAVKGEQAIFDLQNRKPRG